MTRLLPFLFSLFAAAAIAAPQPKPPAPPDLAAPPATAEQLGDGLATVRLVEGTGTEKPIDSDILKLRYTIWRSEGGNAIEHIQPGQAAVVSLSRMMPGWQRVVKQMVAGEQRRAWIPGELTGGKAAAGTGFVIDSELVGIIHGPATPEHLTAAPETATRTRSGLAYEVVRPGTGTRKPGRTTKVQVNYSGWTTEGRLFDSTVLRGQPAEFRLDNVIPGWAEGLQMMTEGEIRRFWIPAKLAYADQPDMPQGMLIFEVELLAIAR